MLFLFIPTDSSIDDFSVVFYMRSMISVFVISITYFIEPFDFFSISVRDTLPFCGNSEIVDYSFNTTVNNGPAVCSYVY